MTGLGTKEGNCIYWAWKQRNAFTKFEINDTIRLSQYH